MKTAILYYTFGGSTQKEAKRLAEETGVPAFRVFEAKNRSLFGSFVSGCYQAMKRKAVKIKPLDVNLAEFDRIMVGCPIWAGYPAPAFNSIVELLPAGKDIELFFCSGSGDSQKTADGTKELIAKKGCTVLSYRDILTGARTAKMKE